MRMSTTLQNYCACPSVEVVQIPGVPGAAPPFNPTMSYDQTLGAPSTQGITPSYPFLPALLYEKNAADKTYSWNITLQQWQAT